MKKVVFALCLFAGSFTALSQSESSNKKRVKYGFNLGLNYSNLLNNEKLPNNASLSNDLGFRLGVLADVQLSDLLSISPKAELAFNNGSVNFANINQREYEVMPISVEIITHFVFKKKNEGLSPYFFFGPNAKIPVPKEIDNSAVFQTAFDFAIDFGIGLDKSVTYFNFSPELRYSFGLLNVNGNPLLRTLRFHNITLVFNFLG